MSLDRTHQLCAVGLAPLEWSLAQAERQETLISKADEQVLMVFCTEIRPVRKLRGTWEIMGGFLLKTPFKGWPWDLRLTHSGVHCL